MKVSLLFGSLFTLTAHAWIERKMLSSLRAPRIGAVDPTEPRQEQRYTPLIMTTADSDIDLVATTPVPTGRERRQVSLGKGKKASILSRSFHVAPDVEVTVYEWEKPAAVVETYWQVEQQGLALTTTSASSAPNSPLLDPFGLVCWPGSVVAAQEMKEYHYLFTNKRVLVLGAGVGVEAQAAAMLGAKQVIATDIHPTTLKLLQYGAEQAGLSSIITTKVLDIGSLEPLPECDIMVVADVLYNERLALMVIQRILEARQNTPAIPVLVTDSQRFVTDFDVTLSDRLKEIGQPRVEWNSRWLPSFTGSGVLIDADQTYEVKARTCWVGR